MSRVASVNVGEFVADSMALTTKQIGAVFLHLMRQASIVSADGAAPLTRDVAACVAKSPAWWKVRNVSAGTDSAKRHRRMLAARSVARHTEEEWCALLAACGGRCLRCGGEDDVTRDHVVPIMAEGDDGISNIQPLCRSCNSVKGRSSTDYRSAAIRLQFAGDDL